MSESSSAPEETSISNTDTVNGQVKWFNNNLNYGFITVLTEGEYNGRDVFVHQTNITPKVSNYRTLTAGEYVSFILKHTDDEKHPMQAQNVTGFNGGKLICDFFQQRNRDDNSNKQYNNKRSEGGGGGGSSSDHHSKHSSP